tara:strand:- start:66 stop:320 length:255 start_codon:yes stop_codon:yes gene_type:complete
MNYYIITREVFETLNKENIDFALSSVDNSKNIVVTSDTIDSTLSTFTNASGLSTYTFNNHTDWVGDNTGVTEQEIADMKYIPGL